MDVKIEPSWKEVLQQEFSKAYFQEIVAFLKIEKSFKTSQFPVVNFSTVFMNNNKNQGRHVSAYLNMFDPGHGKK